MRAKKPVLELPDDPALPLALQPRIRRRVLSALKHGNFIDVAVSGAGLTMDEFSEVRRLGLKPACPDTVPRGLWAAAVEFSRAVDKAIANVEIKEVGKLHRATSLSPTALCFLLERRFGERWGKKDKIEHKLVDPSKLTDAELVTKLRDLGFQAELPPADTVAMLPADTRRQTG